MLVWLLLIITAFTYKLSATSINLRLFLPPAKYRLSLSGLMFSCAAPTRKVWAFVWNIRAQANRTNKRLFFMKYGLIHLKITEIFSSRQ